MSAWNADFSHVYIEEDVREHPRTHRILERIPAPTVIPVHHYKDVFNRPRQRFQAQKRSPKLILARKPAPHLYPGSENAQDFGCANFHYATPLLNCSYNCDYCFLQGMYPSANLVAFVNLEDAFEETSRRIAARDNPQEPLVLAVSYNTDLLAAERRLGFCEDWIGFARSNPQLQIEIRTKSANYSALRHLESHPGVILAWTLTPPDIAARHEQGAPPPASRIRAARRALDDGWLVRICFDPVLLDPGWKETYRRFFASVFQVLPPERLLDVSTGTFRMNSAHFKALRRNRPDSPLVYYPFEHREGLVSLPDEQLSTTSDFLQQALSAYCAPSQINPWNPPPAFHSSAGG